MKIRSTLMGVLLGLVLFTQVASAYESVDFRQSYTASSAGRGTSVPIPEQVIIDLCGDWDGCTLRMGMYNWDGTRRTASREALFYYDTLTRNWRTSYGDASGSNNDNVTQHVMNAWACYFTDGEYISWFNRGDFDTNFALLSWNQYVATCKLTIID